MPITLKANGGIVFDRTGSAGSYPLTTVGADFSPYRNRISNGNMVLSQRNVTNVTTHPSGTTDNTTKHYAADRFRVYSYFVSGSNVLNYRRTYEPTSVTPENHDSYIRITTVTNTVVASGDYSGIMTGIEGFDFYDSFFGSPYGVPFVLSFWARASIAGNYCVSFRNLAFNRAYVTHYTLAANTWTKVYVPLPPCGDSTWNRNTDWSLLIYWTLASGSTFNVPAGSESVWISGNYLGNQYQTNLINQTAGQTFDLTGVCLERAPASALNSYVLRNTSVPTNGITGLTLLQSGDFDDTSFTVSLPFPIRMFGLTTSTLIVGTNGLLGVDATGNYASIPTVLSPASPNRTHVGFFKGDKRLLTLYGGSRTVTQPDGSSLTGYVLRWEGYNFGGSSANKTIVEFTFYGTSETYNDFNFFDVLYTTNANGTTYLELNPGHTNSQASYPYAREIVSSTVGYRCYTKALVDVMGTDIFNAAGVWWTPSTVLYNYSHTTTTLIDDIQYKLGVSTATSKMDSGIDHLRCLRYFEKTADESYVIPATGNASSISSNFGVYYRFKSSCSTTSYIPLQHSSKRTAPTVTLFNLFGVRGQFSLDGGQQGVTGHVFDSSEKSSLTRVDFNVGISHFGYYGTAAIDSDI
jgi:hypothetical protein